MEIWTPGTDLLMTLWGIQAVIGILLIPVLILTVGAVFVWRLGGAFKKSRRDR